MSGILILIGLVLVFFTAKTVFRSALAIFKFSITTILFLVGAGILVGAVLL